jgi:hypothetical protein
VSKRPAQPGCVVQTITAMFYVFCALLSALLQPVTAHTTPLMLGAMRLLPAGLALLGWAAATGRPQLLPKTAVAWAWIAAFALVDGAAFQVRREWCLCS